MEQLKLIKRPTETEVRAEDRQQLFVSLYKQLQRIAQRELSRTGAGVTIGATTLLHEVYLDLHDRRDLTFPDRAHFFSYASRAMRGLIIDYARSRRALKRGAAFEFAPLPTEIPEQAADSAELERLNRGRGATRRRGASARAGGRSRYFGGFSFGDIAGMLGLSERTVQRDWDKARLFLYQCMSDPDAPPGS